MKLRQLLCSIFYVFSSISYADFITNGRDNKPVIVESLRSCGLFDLNYYGHKDGSVSLTIYPNPVKYNYTMSLLSRETADAVDRSANCICADVVSVFRKSWDEGDRAYYRFESQPAANLSYDCPARERKAANAYRAKR